MEAVCSSMGATILGLPQESCGQNRAGGHAIATLRATNKGIKQCWAQGTTHPWEGHLMVGLSPCCPRLRSACKRTGKHHQVAGNGPSRNDHWDAAVTHLHGALGSLGGANRGQGC